LNRLLADENIPKKALEALKQQGIDIVSVADFSTGLSDQDVIKTAIRENRIIVTFDKDFGELIVKRRLKPPGLILLRLTKISPTEVAGRIKDLIKRQIVLDGNIVVVQDDRIRVAPMRRR
jgi:predicted nuclease of predicted toxin-antitoxin system